jgi:Tol biopolymer transport system component
VNRVPVWTPDGAHIVFTSDLSGKTDLWSVAVRNGRAEGSPSLVMKDVGEIRPAGMSRSGSFYIRKTTEGVEQVSIAELSPGGVTRVVESFVGINPRWSPDGKSIAFKRHSTQFKDRFDVIVRSLATGEERTFVHKGINRADPPRWLHEKSGFLTLVDDRSRWR